LAHGERHRQPFGVDVDGAADVAQLQRAAAAGHRHRAAAADDLERGALPGNRHRAGGVGHLDVGGLDVERSRGWADEPNGAATRLQLDAGGLADLDAPFAVRPRRLTPDAGYRHVAAELVERQRGDVPDVGDAAALELQAQVPRHFERQRLVGTRPFIAETHVHVDRVAALHQVDLERLLEPVEIRVVEPAERDRRCQTDRVAVHGGDAEPTAEILHAHALGPGGHGCVGLALHLADGLPVAHLAADVADDLAEREAVALRRRWRRRLVEHGAHHDEAEDQQELTLSHWRPNPNL